MVTELRPETNIEKKIAFIFSAHCLFAYALKAEKAESFHLESI